ncbi:MAG: hypothetical protein JWP91_788 [Fibrobacteres bacterium]|nr:hypothetical protein [Fibrobacterota bacterium]
MFPTRKKNRHLSRNLGLAMVSALGSAGGYWIFKRYSSRRGRERSGPEAASRQGSDAASLAGQWHSLDKESKQGHIPRELDRTPKNLDQTIHTEPFAEEVSYLD